MRSVGSRDERKRIGLGLEMEETELEEGEALSYNNEAQDPTIDPDIALSYIGEKLQNVLGHFQKDFEGGVSAENLGAKFGGYGSFLPTYQRSPSWSHTKSPAEAHDYDSPRSPRKHQLEDQKQNSFASSSASRKAALVENSLKGNNSHLQSRHADESSLKGVVVKKSVNSSDQRTLKVRIKVGSENLSTQKNAEIYSGLGLVVSPSSSFDDSPTTSGRQCGKLTDAPEASPTSILQIMTSYPGELLLSPLSEDLIHLTEKRKPRGKNESKPMGKTSVESSGMLVNGLFSTNGNPKKSKSSEKGDVFSMELTNLKNNGSMDNAVSHLKEKETELDTLGCEKLVSNALKLPLLSSSQDTFFDPAKDNHTATNALKDVTKGETFSAFTEKEHLGNESAQGIGGVDSLSGKLGSSGKVSESKRGNLVSNIAAACREVPRAENILALEQSESIVSKGRKSEEGLKPALEKSSTGGKRKQKVARDAYSSKNDSCDLQKEHEKPGDRYKDFFGDVEFEDEDNESVSGDMTSSGRLKNTQLVRKRSSSDDHSMSKEKVDCKNSEKPQVPENYPGLASQSAPPLGNGPSSEAPIGSVPLVEEGWVSCDKCQKWRLLPLGTNLKSLPDKWLCRMLTWLPGMNRCSVPQEETTNALRALYHPVASIPGPTSENQHSQLNNSFVNPVHENQNSALQTATISGKKKHGSTKACSTDHDGSTNSSNSRKKSLGTSGKISYLNSGKNSPSLEASGHKHLGQSSSTVEKHGDPKKEKFSLVNSSVKGANLKIRRKREADMEGSKASKRMKSEELHFDDDNWASDNGGPSSKAGRRSASLSNNTSGNGQRKYNGQMDFTEAKKDVVSAAYAETHVPGTSDNGFLFSEKRVDNDSLRKRKAMEHHSSQGHDEPISTSGHRHPESGDFMEKMWESDHQKEKKARVLKSGGKDSNGTDGKSRSHKDEHNVQYLSNTQAADYLKNDMGSANPSVAANSSSSKVSGSHKNNTNGQEVRGSPVESVSSSPLKYPNADKVTPTKRKLVGKDDFHDSGSLTAASPRGLFGEGEGGNDQKGIVKKVAIFTVNDPVTGVKHSSEQCKVEEKANIHQSQKKKSGKGLSSHSKDKARASGSDSDKVHIKASDSSYNPLDHKHLHDEKPKSRRNKSDEKSGPSSKGEKLIGKKDTAVGTSSESSKGQSQKRFGHDGQDIIKSQDKKHSIQSQLDNEKLPKKSNQAEVNGNGKSHSLPPLARTPAEPLSGSHKENGVKNSAIEALDNVDAQKASTQRKKAENSNGQPVRLPTPNSHRVRDVDAPSPVRRDSSSHDANNALKEAKDLKHLADRLKNSGSTESIGFYFQAALKFLHGASLLEAGSSEATKHNELMHAMHIYSSTAKLCEFCAHEYEKSKDMAAASLAYKCVEVAYLRVVYSSHASANRDRNELQSALQIVPPGESPSSSASDVDNLNHAATTDKAALAKVVGSPQVSGSHVITSRNRSGFLRVLNFAQDVNFAMEASKKSRIAFTAATSRLGETSHKDSIYSLKKALDYNFQDVDGLLRLIRIAMETISR